MFCAKCGKQLETDTQFCTGCETSIGNEFADEGSYLGSSETLTAVPTVVAITPGASKKNPAVPVGIFAAAAAVIIAAMIVFVIFLNPFSNNPIKNAQVDDVVNFGEVSFKGYWGNDFSEEVNWRVLAVEDNRVLVISEDIIDLRPFSEELEKAAWEQCDLRSWLNADFYNGLPNNMKWIAQISSVRNDEIQEYDLPSGTDTKDTVFLLSTDEAYEYFQNDNNRRARFFPTDDQAKRIFENRDFDIKDYLRDSDNYYYWWLRSPGNGSAYIAACVLEAGDVNVGGDGVNVYYGVRPALWLNR